MIKIATGRRTMVKIATRKEEGVEFIDIDLNPEVAPMFKYDDHAEGDRLIWIPPFNVNEVESLDEEVDRCLSAAQKESCGDMIYFYTMRIIGYPDLIGLYAVNRKMSLVNDFYEHI